MVRIEATSRPTTAQGFSRREAAAPQPAEAGRALVVLKAPADARTERDWTQGNTQGKGRPPAGFVAHLIVSADPTLAPSRAERAQRACRLYAAVQAA